MPRPLKNVSPDTLGGRIRAARQAQHLSLAQVAGQEYSTSLISQIERNRVEPSQESLQFLAERLKLPLSELVQLSQQHRESEAEINKSKEYEEKIVQISKLLENNRPKKTLEELAKINIEQLPTFLRWRFLALRGHCSFKLRQFLPAQRDYLAALALLPTSVPAEQQQEALTLRLNLAITSRELGLLKDALTQFQDVLVRMSVTTPLRYIAETHWELALVIFEQANSQELEQHNHENDLEMQRALQHAETASNLYGSIGETLRASLLQCQISLIEQAGGNSDGARKRLQDVLATWETTLEASEDCPLVRRYTLKERANVTSAAACYLAGIELEAKNYEQAQKYIQQAIQAGNQSYILRRAEAKMTLGRILEATNQNAEAEKAFREAIEELAPTERIAAKIRAYDLLGRHLLKKGATEQGERELDKARKLSRLPATFSSETSSETNSEDNESSK